MLLGQRGAEGGYGAVKAVLVQRNGVHVALREDDKALLTLFDDIHGEKVSSFIKNNCLRGIKILGRGVVHDPSAEADDVAPDVDDGKHQAVAEAVIEGAFFLVFQHQTGLQQFLLGIAFGCHGVQQGAPGVGRKAQSEPRHRGGRKPPFGNIGTGLCGSRGLELIVKEPRSFLTQCPEAFLFLVLGLAQVVFGDLDTGAFG